MARSNNQEVETSSNESNVPAVIDNAVTVAAPSHSLHDALTAYNAARNAKLAKDREEVGGMTFRNYGGMSLAIGEGKVVIGLSNPQPVELHDAIKTDAVKMAKQWRGVTAVLVPTGRRFSSAKIL